ncbi:hypothetical protein QMG72_10775 [Pseudarthrobacter sp. PH31-O2]|nr:hypothetical protein [Pseudarthrobacter sp. PH31-O2]
MDQNRALAAMEDAAKLTGNWIAGKANTVGEGVATSAVVAGAVVVGGRV